MAATQADIGPAFAKNNITVRGDELLDSCADLSARYGLSAPELSDAYDTFSFARNGGNEVTAALLEAFGKHLEKNPPARPEITPIRATRPVALTPAGKPSRVESVLVDASNSQSPTALRTPSPSRKNGGAGSAAGSSAKRSRLSSAFKEREKRGEVQANLNEHIRPDTDAVPMSIGEEPSTSGRCAFELLGAPLAADQRYMADRLEDKVAYLDGRVSELEEALEAQGLGPLQPVTAATQAPGTCVGRVCCDAEGRLNERSVLLEGGLATSQGMRVRLDLSRVPALRLFPGQVIGVTGTNPSGSCLLATQLHTGAPPPLPATPPEQLARFARRTGGRPASIVAAAGPFTTLADLTFEPLEELLASCAAMRPAPTALVLAGPFLDATHPDVASGQLDTPFQRLLEQERVGEFAAAHPATRVLLAPSTRDVTAAPVFPTPPLRRPSEKAGAACAPLPDNVTMLPNPATFAVGEVVIGLVTADILRTLSGNEVARPTGQGDRLAAVAAQLLQQRSYFPVFPPPPGAMLDTALGAQLLRLPASPDVLLLPSDLAAFAKLLPVAGGKVVCVNPGRLARGITGGSWAHLQVRVSEEAAAALRGEPPKSNAPVPHRVDARCRVDIQRI